MTPGLLWLLPLTTETTGAQHYSFLRGFLRQGLKKHKSWVKFPALYKPDA